MKIFVISLTSALDRRQSIVEQFKEVEQDFEFFDAIDGREAGCPLFEKYNEKKRLHAKGYPLTKGELGCFASHYLLWEKCIELNEPIVVVEDDAQLEDCFADSIQLVPQLEKYGYVRLFFNHRRERPFTRMGTLGKHDIVQYHRGPRATRAYYIAPSSAKKFIDSAQEWYLPVDDYMDKFWANKVPCRGLIPGLINADTEFESSIEQIEAVNKGKKKNRLSREIYSLKNMIQRKWFLITHSIKKRDN